MTLAEYSMAAFALLNGGRTVAYFPQMIRIYRDPHGAAAVSILTWALFAAANAATVWYALAVSHDHIVASVFSLNAVGCVAIVGLTAFKRMSGGQRRTNLWQLIESLRQSQALVDPLNRTNRPRCVRHDSPSLRHRDDMILRGVMS